MRTAISKSFAVGCTRGVPASGRYRPASARVVAAALRLTDRRATTIISIPVAAVVAPLVTPPVAVMTVVPVRPAATDPDRRVRDTTRHVHRWRRIVDRRRFVHHRCRFVHHARRSVNHRGRRIHHRRRRHDHRRHVPIREHGADRGSGTDRRLDADGPVRHRRPARRPRTTRCSTLRRQSDGSWSQTWVCSLVFHRGRLRDPCHLERRRGPFGSQPSRPPIRKGLWAESIEWV